MKIRENDHRFFLLYCYSVGNTNKSSIQRGIIINDKAIIVKRSVRRFDNVFFCN